MERLLYRERSLKSVEKRFSISFLCLVTSTWSEARPSTNDRQDTIIKDKRWCHDILIIFPRLSSLLVSSGEIPKNRWKWNREIIKKSHESWRRSERIPPVIHVIHFIFVLSMDFLRVAFIPVLWSSSTGSRVSVSLHTYNKGETQKRVNVKKKSDEFDYFRSSASRDASIWNYKEIQRKKHNV